MKELPRKRSRQYKCAGRGKILAWSREGAEKEGRCGWGGMNERQGDGKGWPGQVTQGLLQSQPPLSVESNNLGPRIAFSTSQSVPQNPDHEMQISVVNLFSGRFSLLLKSHLAA